MLIYICNHKEESSNPAETRTICNLIARRGHVPIAPRLYFPQFIHSNTEPLSGELLSLCDEVWVIGAMTDTMKNEVEQAIRECIPVKCYASTEAMARALEDKTIPSPSAADAVNGGTPRSFDELMGELVKVNSEEEEKEIIEFAFTKARALEPRTHMDRGIVEKLIFLYNSMLHDMEKIEMTKEEREVLLREGLGQIADELNINKRLAAAVLLMSQEEQEDTDSIVEVITEYCAECVPDIVEVTGLPQPLVDKVVFISNIWRWRDRKEIMANKFATWWPKHVKDLAGLLGQSESVIQKILDAELSRQ